MAADIKQQLAGKVTAERPAPDGGQPTEGKAAGSQHEGPGETAGAPRKGPATEDKPGTHEPGDSGGRSPAPVESSPGQVKDTARQETGGGTDVPGRPSVPAKAAPSAREDLVADGAFGWRQYLAQSAAPTTGVVQRAVRQAAARAHTQIVQEARYIRQNGKSEVSVRLHPPELGRIKVAIAMRDGKLDVSIRVEDPQVREALKLELEGLERTLRDAQLDLTRLEVSDYHAGTREGMQDRFSEGDGVASGEQVPDQSGGDDADNVHAWAVFTESGGVDCLI